MQKYPIVPQVQNNSEITDWKTYRNDEYGFKFKYPSYARVEKGDLSGISASAVLELDVLVGQETIYNGHIFIRVYKGEIVASMPAGESEGVINFKSEDGATVVQISNDSLGEKDIFNSVKSTFKFINSVDGIPLPKINSISPSSGPKGTVVEIRGSNLSGFEGDLDVYFERPDGKKVMLTDNYGSYQLTQDELIRVKVIEPCQEGEKVMGRYSGIESECNYLELTPGMYKVYVTPWDKKSNIVSFELTK